MTHSRQALLLVGALLAGSAAFAGCPPPDGGDRGRPDRPHGPPPEAVAACKGKAAGATVSFKMRDGKTLTGICQQMGDVLAARPEGMGEPPKGGGGGRGAPPEGRGAPPEGGASAPPPPRCDNDDKSSSK